LEEESDKDAACHQFYSTLHSKYFTKETLQGFGDFKIGGQVIHTVKYADALGLLAKEERILEDMKYTLTEVYANLKTVIPSMHYH